MGAADPGGGGYTGAASKVAAVRFACRRHRRGLKIVKSSGIASSDVPNGAAACSTPFTPSRVPGIVLSKLFGLVTTQTLAPR